MVHQQWTKGGEFATFPVVQQYLQRRTIEARAAEDAAALALRCRCIKSEPLLSERKTPRGRKGRSLERQHHGNHQHTGHSATSSGGAHELTTEASLSSDDETGSNTDTIRENTTTTTTGQPTTVAIADVHHRLHSTIIADTTDSSIDPAKTPITCTDDVELDVNQNHVSCSTGDECGGGYERMQTRAPQHGLRRIKPAAGIPIRRKQFFEPISDSSTSFDEMSGDDGGNSSSAYDRDETNYERIGFGVNEVR